MKSEIKKIIDILSHTFEKNAWHGPAVKEVLANLKPEHANLRVGTSHSIEELIRHMAAWRGFVAKKLEGDEKFDLTDEQNFPAAKNLSEAIQLLEQKLPMICSINAFRVGSISSLRCCTELFIMTSITLDKSS